ncbi:MAG: EAL domain-containing protein [Betaproteobacteria bacterium]|nr:EAL domain-containing protein [Betaproteobacteria bacterium]MDE2131575.1 EAL domain-containing protein [Betaproteobacteria bacterium]MDE2212534.1 EAL domain-containing protein [Betaproteobacteria bacterium]MDE2354441.1 EAL domain-containing protein [Betaproteobacteria bacterium]
MDPNDFVELSCANCLEGAGLDIDFSFAFQPIVDTVRQNIFSYEALVRGSGNEPASHVLNQLTDHTRYRFDQACRVKIIRMAVELGIPVNVNINFYPNAVYKAELCIRTTLAAADTFGFPINQIIFEVTEGEKIEDHAHLRSIIQAYRRLGFRTAIDDFGAGYSGLNLLSEFQPDFIKLDMKLVQGINNNKPRQAIVRGIIQVCKELGIDIIAEGVETREELSWLSDAGISLFQGYHFARPGFEILPAVPAAAYL